MKAKVSLYLNSELNFELVKFYCFTLTNKIFSNLFTRDELLILDKDTSSWIIYWRANNHEVGIHSLDNCSSDNEFTSMSEVRTDLVYQKSLRAKLEIPLNDGEIFKFNQNYKIDILFDKSLTFEEMLQSYGELLTNYILNNFEYTQNGFTKTGNFDILKWRGSNGSMVFKLFESKDISKDKILHFDNVESFDSKVFFIGPINAINT